MLNKRKCFGASQPNTNPVAPLNAVEANDSYLGMEDLSRPSNIVNASDTLIGLEDMAHGTNDDGIPFILVDGAAYTTRSSLDLALSRVEQKRMDQIIMQIDSSDLPQIEDTGPPPELDMDINLSSGALAQRRAAEDERRFQKDISELTFWPPETEETVTTPTTQSHSSISSMEQVILKLDQMRGSTKQVPPPSTETPVAKLPVRPGIQRQGTFDIKRNKEGDRDKGPDIAIICPATSKNSQLHKTLYQAGIPSLISRKHPSKSPGNEFITVRAGQLINHIGDHFVELCRLYEEENNRVLNEGSTYTYLVTISPANGASNCTIDPISDSEVNYLCLSRNSLSSHTISNLKCSKSELSTSVVGRHSPAAGPLKHGAKVTYTEERGRSQFLRKTTSSIVNIASPAKYYQGRKRD
ncbi:uncharacterized protein LOC110185071 [Drosophila serrata]|uniref:uncharacterized protein LOC110185071 n=1 Tax=Drosophila serrata TaxID=7274 RepID=UPI000A1D0C5F|nr:uncharacterized protein LOC110185071 [Drosophila serrata]